MADTATFSGAMKTKLIGPIRDTMHKGRVLLFGGNEANPTGFQGIKRSAEGIDFVGNEFRIPFKTKRNQAVGFRSEHETLPAPGASGYTYLTEPMRYAYALFNITGQLMRAADSNEGAFASAFKTEMEDTVLASKLDHNRAAFGDGVGIIATVRTNQGAPAALLDVNSTINLRGGEVVDIVTVATGVIAAGNAALTVLSVDRTNRQITLSPATGTIATTSMGLVRASSDSTASVPNNSWNKEILGLSAIIAASGTLHGVSPTVVPFWKSYVDAGGGAISDNKLRLAKDETGFESGVDVDSGVEFVLLTTRGIRRNYAATLTGVKQFTDEKSVRLHGGFTAVMFDENPIYIDDSTPIGTVFGISVKDLFWAEMSDWDWMDEDGKVLKWENRKDRYTAVLFKYTQLGTTARNRHFKLTGITDDVK